MATLIHRLESFTGVLPSNSVHIYIAELHYMRVTEGQARATRKPTIIPNKKNTFMLIRWKLTAVCCDPGT